MTEIVAKVGIGVKSEMGSRGQRTENRGKAQLLREWKINVIFGGGLEDGCYR
jgi:hypothetical protein